MKLRNSMRRRRIVALTPGLARSQIDLVLAQKAPNILNINIFQRLSQQRTRPPGIALGRWPIQECQNAPVRRLTVNRLLARSRAIFKAGQAVIGKAPPPMAHDARLNTHFLGDRTRTATFGCQQDNPRSLHVALECARCPAARLKLLAIFGLSRTSPASGIIPILNHDSPAKKSGY
jgi:hypothetical protein